MNPYIFLLFFVSGACGLIYQVVWTRMMTHVFGSTVLAVSTVLAAFMAGLALGSYYLGKRSHVAGSPLKRYAAYEFGIGGAALVVLFLIGHITPLSIWMTDFLGSSPYLFHSLRFIVVFLLILLPTTLMGATLPILSQLILTRPNSVGRGLGSLYATNTVGAVAGCLLAGYFLIGSIGIHNSIYVAAFLNICIGAASWLLASRRKLKLSEDNEPAVKPNKTKSDQTAEPLPLRLRVFLLWGFALSGLTAFAYEVLWTRSLIFMLGHFFGWYRTWRLWIPPVCGSTQESHALFCLVAVGNWTLRGLRHAFARVDHTNPRDPGMV
jgi:spermidine synthase